jgi:hypothetical protein
MWDIPKEVETSLRDRILDTLLELGYRTLRGSGEIPVGSQGDLVKINFRQATSDPVWLSPRNYGNINITYKEDYVQIISRRIKIKFDWDGLDSYMSSATATNYIWTDETTKKLKEKVAEVCKVAETRVQQRQKLHQAEAEFAQAVRAVFPHNSVKMEGFSATIDDLKIHKAGDSFQFVFTYAGSGNLADIKAIRDAMLEAGQEKYLTL